LVGIAIQDEQQLALLKNFTNEFREEYNAFPLNDTGVAHQYYVKNRTYEQIDGEILYCMIRHFKPRKIIEIGSGFSTYLAAQALLKNFAEAEDGNKCEFTAIEPYPNKVLEQGFPGLTKLIKNRVQDVSLDEFAALKQNDILFIDSSHVLKTGSDVQYEFLEILPRLNKGVIVHVHDIFMPAEYPREWIMKHLRFWNEQYLLQAFLTFNDSFEILWAASYMLLKHPERLKEAFPSYSDNTWPGSFWIRRIK
jgi:predicted O-methyltransferase YrrM